MTIPEPALILFAIGGFILWAGWVIFRSRSWPYANEPLWVRSGYFVLLTLFMGAAAVWLLSRTR